LGNDDWGDFSRRFVANFESLSDNPAQPWDLISIKRQNDETLSSFLRRFQTMRNRIPEVAEATVIEDLYRGSNNPVFVRAILQKAPATSEQLFRETNIYITMDERAHDLIIGTKLVLPVPRKDTNQQPNKRWEKRKCTPPGHLQLEPTARPAVGSGHWMRSSTPSARTTRTSDTPCKTAEISKTPSDMADHSRRYHLPLLEESLLSLGSLSSRREVDAKPSHTSIGRSMSY
jgi:hypothetical protein